MNSFDDLFGNTLKTLPVVTGATVNTTTGTDETGAIRHKKYGAEVESMEGAGALKFGNDFKVPVLQIRSISNIAGIRDKANWNIGNALKSLKILCGALL